METTKADLDAKDADLAKYPRAPAATPEPSAAAHHAADANLAAHHGAALARGQSRGGGGAIADVYGGAVGPAPKGLAELEREAASLAQGKSLAELEREALEAEAASAPAVAQTLASQRSRLAADAAAHAAKAVEYEDQMRDKFGEVRSYLEAQIMPTLQAALETMVEEQPADPHEWLAAYLVAHNPKKDLLHIPDAHVEANVRSKPSAK